MFHFLGPDKLLEAFLQLRPMRYRRFLRHSHKDSKRRRVLSLVHPVASRVVAWVYVATIIFNGCEIIDMFTFFLPDLKLLNFA